MSSPSPSSSPPRLDDLDILDEAMVDLQVDLLEYLEREDNPDPDYHPPVRSAVDAGVGGGDGLPPAEPRSPPPGAYHEHSSQCPYKWKPPSLKVIYRQPGRRQLLFQAGILNFIAYNYSKVKRRFLEEEWRDITWSEDLEAIVVAPTLPLPPTVRPGAALPVPTRKEITVAYLQRIWPGLPSKVSHRANDLAVAPNDTDTGFMAQALLRYFALQVYANEEGSLGIILDTCFHMALYRYLLRLAYIFGWRGYSRTFPAKYFPIAVMTFVSGAHYPWADLLLRELIHDLKHRRRCPRMVRVWKAIWDFVVADSRNLPHIPPPEKRYLYVPYMTQCRDIDMPYRQLGVHYHAREISSWTPQSFRSVLERGGCLLDDCDP